MIQDYGQPEVQSVMQMISKGQGETATSIVDGCCLCLKHFLGIGWFQYLNEGY